jgi:hypothetical protein
MVGGDAAKTCAAAADEVPAQSDAQSVTALIPPSVASRPPLNISPRLLPQNAKAHCDDPPITSARKGLCQNAGAPDTTMTAPFIA